MPEADRFRNGGRAVVAALAAHDVDTIFGIPGTHNLEFYRHLPEFGIRAVTPRHEQGAGYGADGYFLLSGKPGVVITTSGPGLTNVVTAAATAYAESRPMLILSPGVPTGLERAEDSVLNGSDQRLFARRLADFFTGRDPRGGNVDTTINPEVQQAAWDAMQAVE